MCLEKQFLCRVLNFLLSSEKVKWVTIKKWITTKIYKVRIVSLTQTSLYCTDGLNPFATKVTAQQYVGRMPVLQSSNLQQEHQHHQSTIWVSRVTKPLESFVNETSYGPKVSHMTKTRPAFIWHRNLLGFVQFLLHFQYFSDLWKWLTLHQYTCIQLFITVRSKQWAWLWTTSDWMYLLLTVIVVQFEIYLVTSLWVNCKQITQKLETNAFHQLYDIKIKL